MAKRVPLRDVEVYIGTVSENFENITSVSQTEMIATAQLNATLALVAAVRELTEAVKHVEENW